MDLLKKADKLIEEKKFLDAINVLSEYLMDHPDAAIFYKRAKCYFFVKNYEQAIVDLTQAILIQPTNAHFYGERALSFHMFSKHAEAMLDFDKAVSLEPNNGFRYASRAFIKDRIGDQHGAVKDYQKAIALDPEDAISYNNLGLVLEKMGNKKASQQSFAKADKLSGRTEQVDTKERPQSTIKEEKTVKEPLPKNEASLAKTLKHTLKSLLTDKEERKQFAKFISQKWKG